MDRERKTSLKENWITYECYMSYLCRNTATTSAPTEVMVLSPWILRFRRADLSHSALIGGCWIPP